MKNQPAESSATPSCIQIGTPLSPTATRVLFCGGGELGKEVVIELQRLGVEVIVVDRYPNAPAMQVAHRSHVISMLDGEALRRIIETEKPDYIVPEIEAIATDTLLALENEGFSVIPTARAAKLTMNREGIRRLAAEELGIATSPYRFAETREEFDAVKAMAAKARTENEVLAARLTALETAIQAGNAKRAPRAACTRPGKAAVKGLGKATKTAKKPPKTAKK